MRYLFCFLKLLVFSQFALSQQLKFVRISPQKINMHALVGRSSDKETFMYGFRISDQITYKQYKEYLHSILKDSTKEYYESQLPNFDKQNSLKEKYLNSNEFDNYPVIGVSYDNAMNYGIWYGKTSGKQNKYYRLPAIHEWLIMNKKAKKKINETESSFLFDWTLNAFEENLFYFQKPEEFPFLYFHQHKSTDHKVYKRKSVIGSSFRMKFNDPIEVSSRYGFYADQGYPDIGFRLVELDSDIDFIKRKNTNTIQNDIKLK